MSSKIRVVAANLYVYNPRIKDAITYLETLRKGQTAYLLSEAHRFGRVAGSDEAGPISRLGAPHGAVWNGQKVDAGRAECKVVLSPDVKVKDHGVLDLSETVDSDIGRKYWKGRSLAWALTDTGQLFGSLHCNAIIQNKVTGEPLENRGVDEHIRGMKVLEPWLKDWVNKGVEVTIGGDGNWRHGKGPEWEWAPGVVLERCGLNFMRDRGVDFIASTQPLNDFTHIIAPPGADHPWVYADLNVKEEEPPVPELTINQKFVKELRRLGADVLTREQWGSDPDGTKWPLAPDVPNVYAYRQEHKPHRLLPGKASDTLVQHISVTTPTKDAAADMRGIERIGFDRFGSGVSYNVAVHPSGKVLIGQPLDAKGTHTVNDKGVAGYSYDQNYVALACVWLGNVGQTPTPEAQAAIILVLKALINIGALTPGFDYVPHSLFAYKDCPIQAMRDLMAGIRKAATDKPVEPNRVERAHAEVEDLVRDLRQAQKAVDSIIGNLLAVPAEKRPAVAKWMSNLVEVSSSIRATRKALATASEDAPDK